MNHDRPLNVADKADRKPWAFVAHKDGYWAGACAANLSKNELRKFVGDFIADGFAITTVYDRAEYNALFETMPSWKSRYGSAVA